MLFAPQNDVTAPKTRISREAWFAAGDSSSPRTRPSRFRICTAMIRNTSYPVPENPVSISFRLAKWQASDGSFGQDRPLLAT